MLASTTLLLAQATGSAGNGGGGDEAAAAAAAIAAILVMVLVTLAIALAINIVICFLIYAAQKQVPAEHRQIEPGLVWLLLIPIFNIVWNFWVFLKVPDSYRAAFAARGELDVADCGRGVGQWYAICCAVATAGSFIPIVSCFSAIAGLASLVLLILFLVKLWGLKARLAVAAPPSPA